MRAITEAFKKIEKKIRKVPSVINIGLEKLAKRLVLGIFTVIKAKIAVSDNQYGTACFVFIFGKQVYPRAHSYCPCSWANPDQPVMYFKVNRMSDYVVPCVQHWVNVAYYMKADYYFLCDNTELQYCLLRTIHFPSSSIKFIPSIRKPLKRICKIIDPVGYRNPNMLCAHISPFYYAQKSKVKNFWAIDADDTMICMHHYRVAEALLKAQAIAEEKKIATLSLDMWCSRTMGRHWSWGVAYVNDYVGYLNLIKTLPYDWYAQNYKDVYHLLNLDWVFTYFKSDRGIPIETFYIDNTYFIHWGSFLRNPVLAAIFHWCHERVEFPILQRVFQDDQLGMVAIADCIKIPFDANEEEGLAFLENEVTNLKRWIPEARRLNNGGDFSTMEKSLEKL